MSNTITSNNMNLPIPVVGVDAGPDYSLNVNACLALIDSHNHSAGNGVQITPNGLNITSDLSFQGNNAILLRSLRLNPNASALSGASDLGCLYEAGVDLYYNDGNGNQIRITQSGSVAGSTGTITGLPSGTASASYSSGSGTFVFQSATSTAANLDVQSIILRNSSASSYGLTLSAPSLSSNYSLVLPTIPAQTNLVTLDSSGNLSSTTYNAAVSAVTSVSASGANAIRAGMTVTQGTSVTVGNLGLSNSTGSYSTSSSSFVSIGVSVTISTVGNPVELRLVPDQSVNGALAGFSIPVAAAASTYEWEYSFVRGSTGLQVIGLEYSVGNTSVAGQQYTFPILPGSIYYIDSPVAGTYTYTLNVKVIGGVAGGTLFLNNFKIFAKEMS